MALNLVKFPLEILLHICELLSHAHEPSLRCFALASKYCYAIASCLLFRTITFKITTPSKLQAHVRECTRLLQRDGAFHHVRRLVLVSGGFEHGNKWSKDGNANDEEDAELSNFDRWQLSPAPLNWDLHHQRLRGIPNHSDSACRGFAVRTPVHAAYDEDAKWAPLADLIRLLPALADLIYEWPTQFPPCLLQALHTKTCNHTTRLHLRSFNLRMLGERGLPPPKTITGDSHELDLITSPCLHAIWLADCDGRVAPQQEDDRTSIGRQLDTLEQIVRTEGLAPNLREVRLELTSEGTSPLPPRPYPSGWLPGEVGARSRKQQPVALEYLGLGCRYGFHQITGFQVQRWTELAELSGLQALELTAPVTECGLDTLLSLRFPDLTTLSFLSTRNPSMGYLNKVNRFLARLPRLESLRVMGWDWSIGPLAPDLTSTTTNGDDLSPACVKTLVTLWLDHRVDTLSPYSRSSVISPSEIARLGAFYPHVEILSIPIRRSKGDADEAARYKAIGASFPRLKRLALNLDASAPMRELTREGVSFEDKWVQPWGYTNRHIMDVMANSAVDDKLARQIFEAVALPGLETMMVRAEGGGDFKMPPDLPREWRGRWDYKPNITRFLRALAREWIIDTVNPRREVRIVKVGAEKWKWRPETQPWMMPSTNDFLEHFKRLWPDINLKSEDWYDQWKSWPLTGVTCTLEKDDA
ncbi:hypothetical protein B0T21DRAFT_365967 [Apiosordaria backusii]|uniref:Uncharacterized protein n=1 Tax=Apiosordaria backusii TaxID=314023 RepID=A0AA40BKJ6_9PEZI|nr:hypothetical protein B0T21DRAFT_365967 [Apiosordaria backusii]